MKTVREMIDTLKKNHYNNELKLLIAEFEVTDRCGQLWLTHRGVAFMKMGEYASAKEVAALLNQCRETAIEYCELL